MYKKQQQQQTKEETKRRMDLDSILDQALDDFEEQELQEKTASASQSNNAPPEQNAMNDLEAERIENQKRMQSFIDSLQDPSYGPTVQNVQCIFFKFRC